MDRGNMRTERIPQGEPLLFKPPQGEILLFKLPLEKTPELFDSPIFSRPQEALDFITNMPEPFTEYSVTGKDLDGNILLWSEGARRLYGYEPAEVVGKANSSILYDPEDVKMGKPQQVMAAALRDGKWEGRINRRRKNGVVFTARVVITPRRDAAGKPVGFLLISEDISDEIRMGQDARIFIEASLDPLVTISADAKITDVNEATLKVTGLPREKLIGTDFSNHFTESEKASEGYGQVFATGSVTEYPVTVRPAEDKSLSEQRKREEEALVKLRKAVDTSGEMVFMTDRNGTITFINPEFTRVYGYAESEVVGKVTPRILKSGAMPPEEWAAFWRAILEKRVVKKEIINRTKDGKLVTVESSANPILDDQGNITDFLAIQRDVTARKELEQQLRQAQKMEAVGQLAGGVAHDFNNLLTVINGYSQTMLERLQPDDQHWKFANEIKKAGDRAASLTRRLLAFSRQQVLKPQVLSLHAVVSNMYMMLKRVIGEDIDLVTTTTQDLGRVKVDPNQMEQILLNLVVNARDAMPRGGKLVIETANVELDETSAREQVNVTPGRHVMLAVSDTGTGMDAETQRRIFEPFFTTKEQGKGTGLGLATVYGIVKQSGGNVRVYSEPGCGTTFKIYLPRVDEALGPIERAQAPAESLRGSETILIVEDEPAVRMLVRKTLEDQGYQVLEANNGADALLTATVYQGTISLVLTDVVMPEMCGREVAEKLLALRPDVKVLYMSGYTADTIVRQGIMDSDTLFLQKPFAPETVVRKVREALDSAAELRSQVA